jgi:hypothetical protein
VKAQACRTIRANDQRLKLLIGCGNWDGPETGAAEGKIGRQGARICLQFSANSQDVHMLRSIPPRLVDEAAGLHDDGVMTAVAATYKQFAVPEGMNCCDVPQEMLHPHFRSIKGRLALQTFKGGMGMRAWRQYQNPAFVGMVSLAMMSAQQEIGNLTHCAFPAVAAVIGAAARVERGHALSADWAECAAMEMVTDLGKAWEHSRAQTKEEFPAGSRHRNQERSEWGGYWIEETNGGRIESILRMPPQAQRHLSKAQKRIAVKQVRVQMKREAYEKKMGATRRLADFDEYEAADGSGAYYDAVPWMEEGEMNVPDVEELYNYVLMYGGELPTALIPTGLGAELPEPRTEEAKLTRVVMIRRHLDHIVESNLAAVSKVRTKTHDKVQNISVAMLKNVGAEGTVLEPRAWDMGKHEKHHRPDINTILPCGKKVLDVKLVWARCTKQHLAAEASKKETEAVEATCHKEYSEGMERVNARQREIGGQEEEMICMAFAARTGGWGADAKGLWEKLVVMAKDKGEEADLYGWHAMNWQRHWQQRIGVAIARGRAQMVMAVMATIAHPTKAEEEEERHAETQESCPFTSGGPPARRVKRPKKTDKEQ